jgi:hypothetical protein
MEIKLTPQDVNNALVAYLQSKNIDTSQPISFAFSNKRKKGGIYAIVSIGMQPQIVQAPVQEELGLGPVVEEVQETVVAADVEVIEETNQAPSLFD